jgi:hypothetical protein
MAVANLARTLPGTHAAADRKIPAVDRGKPAPAGLPGAIRELPLGIFRIFVRGITKPIGIARPIP